MTASPRGLKLKEARRNQGWFLGALILGISWIASPADAVFTRGGGLGVGTRAMGMAGAFTAVADDPSAEYWNPAGLAQLSRIEFAGMYGSLYNDKTRNTYFTVQYPMHDDIHLSLSASNLFFTELQGAHEDTYSGSIALPLNKTRTLSAGLNLHYLFANLKLPGMVIRGRAVDLGVLYRKPLKNGRELSAGLCVANLSSSARFDSGVEQTIPRVFSPGLAFHFSPETLMSFDLPWTDDDTIASKDRLHFRAGAEHWFFDHRVGFRTGYISYSTISGQITFGTSYQGKNWGLDYAYLNHSENLGNSHRISASCGFAAGGEAKDSNLRPYHLKSWIGDTVFQIVWTPPQGVSVDGYWVYVKKDGEKEFTRAQQALLTADNCLLRGAVNGTRYRVYVTAILGGKEGPRSGTLSVIPRPMSAEAAQYYELGVKQFDVHKLSESLYSARKAEVLEPNNYEIKELLRKLENAYEKGLIEPKEKAESKPTVVPRAESTPLVTTEPTAVSTAEPTRVSTMVPTVIPTVESTPLVTMEPTAVPTRSAQSEKPTAVSTPIPTNEMFAPKSVSVVPTVAPQNIVPTVNPTNEPKVAP